MCATSGQRWCCTTRNMRRRCRSIWKFRDKAPIAPPRSLREADGSRECAPDDRLRDEAIQSAFALWIASLALAMTDGDDLLSALLADDRVEAVRAAAGGREEKTGEAEQDCGGSAIEQRMEYRRIDT